MTRFWRVVACAASLVLGADAARAQAPAVLGPQEAREEIELLYQRIVTEHPDPTWSTDPTVWAARLDALRRRPGPISVAQQYFDLSSLMSLATDTHVQIYPNADTPGFETTYPIRFRLFSDGVYITAADGPYRDWVGARIVSVGGRPTSELVERLSHLAFSDHPLRKRSWGVEYLMPHPATYAFLGLTGADGAVRLVLQMVDGVQRDARLDETAPQSFDEAMASGAVAGYYWPAGWRTLDDLILGEPPISRAHLDRNYWYADLEDGRIGYLQLNVPEDQAGADSLLNFTLATFADLANRKTRPERLILDIRYDLGGSIGRSLPIAYLARASGYCCDPGAIVVLIGRETVSAGSVLAGTAEVAAYAVTIGEPTGGRPNLFLGHTAVELPYSKLSPQISSEFYIGTDSADRRLFVAPDVPVVESFANVMTGRDLALERAIAMTAEEARALYPGASHTRPWTRPSQAAAWP